MNWVNVKHLFTHVGKWGKPYSIFWNHYDTQGYPTKRTEAVMQDRMCDVCNAAEIRRVREYEVDDGRQ